VFYYHGYSQSDITPLSTEQPRAMPANVIYFQFIL